MIGDAGGELSRHLGLGLARPGLGRAGAGEQGDRIAVRPEDIVGDVIADDPVAARAAALELARLNTERKELEAKMQVEALTLVDARVASLAGHVPSGVCV